MRPFRRSTGRRSTGRRSTGRRSTTSDAAQAGFTLLELMVVVMVLGLLLRIVVSNMGRFIPSSALDGQANAIRFNLDYLRSEAKIQGKPYSLELDLENHATRVVLPPEDKLVTTTEDTVGSAIPLGWQQLEDFVKFNGHGIHGREIHTKNTVLITFDENGFTADQSIFLQYDEPDPRRIWSIHLNGLNGTTTVVRNEDGRRDIVQTVSEGNF